MSVAHSPPRARSRDTPIPDISAAGTPEPREGSQAQVGVTVRKSQRISNKGKGKNTTSGDEDFILEPVSAQTETARGVADLSAVLSMLNELQSSMRTMATGQERLHERVEAIEEIRSTRSQSRASRLLPERVVPVPTRSFATDPFNTQAWEATSRRATPTNVATNTPTRMDPSTFDQNAAPTLSDRETQRIKNLQTLENLRQENLQRESETSADRFIRSQAAINRDQQTMIDQQAQQLSEAKAVINRLQQGERIRPDHVTPRQAGAAHGNALDTAFTFASAGDSNRTQKKSIKASDIGFFDPDDENVPVESYIRRLEHLAFRHGETAVTENLDQALKHVSWWLSSLSSEDLISQRTLSGWIALLRRDFGISKGQAMKQLHSYSYKDASSTSEFVSKMVSLMISAGILDEEVQCVELVGALPTRWKEGVSIQAPKRVTQFWTILRDVEMASGWPSSESKSRTGKAKSESPDRSRKRGGSSSNPSWRDQKKSKSESPPDRRKQRKDLPYPCTTCKKLGRPGSKTNHWFEDCPENKNKGTKERIHNVHCPSDDDGGSSQDERSSDPESSLSKSDSSSTNYVSFIKVNAIWIQSRISSSHSHTPVVDSILDSRVPYGKGLQFKHQREVLLFAQTSSTLDPFPIIADLGCGPTLIDEHTRQKHFPNSKILHLENPIVADSGFNGKGPEAIKRFFLTTLLLPTDNGTLVKVLLEIHVTESPIQGSGFLLGGDAMRYNMMSICYPTRSVDVCTRSGVMKCPMASVHNPADVEFGIRNKHEVIVPAESARFVEIQNISSAKGDYSVSPLRPNPDEVSGVPHCVVSSSTHAINFANFSKQDITVPAGKLLGVATLLDNDTHGINCTMMDFQDPLEEGILDLGDLMDPELGDRGSGSPKYPVVGEGTSLRSNSSVLVGSMMNAGEVITDHAFRHVADWPNPSSVPNKSKSAPSKAPLSSFMEGFHAEDIEPDEVENVGVSLTDLTVHNITKSDLNREMISATTSSTVGESTKVHPPDSQTDHSTSKVPCPNISEHVADFQRRTMVERSNHRLRNL